MEEKAIFKNIATLVFSLLIILFSIFLCISSITLYFSRNDIIYYPFISITFSVVSLIFLILGVYNIVSLIVKKSCMKPKNFFAIITFLYLAAFMIAFIISLSYFLFSPNPTVDEVILAEVYLAKVALPIGFSFSIASLVLILCSINSKRKPTTKKKLIVISCFLSIVPIIILSLFVFACCLFHIFVYAQAIFLLLEISFGIYLVRSKVDEEEKELLNAPKGEIVE